MRSLSIDFKKFNFEDKSLFDVTDVESCLSEDLSYCDEDDDEDVDGEGHGWTALNWSKRFKISRLSKATIKDILLVAFTIFIVYMDQALAPDALKCAFSSYFISGVLTMGCHEYMFPLGLVSLFNGTAVSILDIINCIYHLRVIQSLVETGLLKDEVLESFGLSKINEYELLARHISLFLWQILVLIFNLCYSAITVIGSRGNCFKFRIVRRLSEDELLEDDEVVILRFYHWSC